MQDQKLRLIGEQTSPLFRIMWVTNPDDLTHRHFDNNISAFHVGKGYIISVAHNLRTENPLIKSISDGTWETDIFPKLNPAQKAVFNQCYVPDGKTGKRHIQVTNPAFIQTISETFRSIQFDTRWQTLAEKNISTPNLIIQFSNSKFYDDQKLADFFDDKKYFFEATLNRHTFLLKLKLVKAFYGSDLAVYRIDDTSSELIDKIPSLEIDFSIIGDQHDNLYCLQSSPAGFLGRLLNKAWMEGYLDHHQVFADRTGGNYILEGIRYLIKGYFRFGSSGAPYLMVDKQTGKISVNAVQSEASPIQLSINNNREGNYQYVNAIASPLRLIEQELKSLLQA